MCILHIHCTSFVNEDRLFLSAQINLHVVMLMSDRNSNLQLPRPRWLETSTRFGAYWLSSPSGVLLRRFTLAVHGFVIARQVGRTILPTNFCLLRHNHLPRTCTGKCGVIAQSQAPSTQLLLLCGAYCKGKASTCNSLVSHHMSMRSSKKPRQRAMRAVLKMHFLLQQNGETAA